MTLKLVFAIAGLYSVFTHAAETDFKRALTAMVERDVEVQVLRSKVEASGAQVGAAWGAFTPQLNLLAQQSHTGGSVPNPSGALYQPSRLYALNATWNLFRSGADAAGVRAARLDQQYQESLLENAYLVAEEKAARSLISLIAQKQAVEALKRSEDSVVHYLEIAQARFKKSLLSREETDKFAVDAANAEAQRADAEIALNTAQADVEALLGQAQLTLLWPWEKELESAVVGELVGAKAGQALGSRPDVRAARKAFEGESARGRYYFRSMLPTVDLNYQEGETHSRGQAVSDWSSLVTLTIPLWSGLRDYSIYKTQVATQTAADLRLRQLERDVVSGLEATQANFKLSRGQYSARVRNLATARHILDQDAARFRVGRADANELNLDLARVTAAEILAIQGLQQVHLAYMRLMHEFGRRVP